MGTRGAWGFRLREKDHIFSNANDSYPDGLGKDLLTALHGKALSDGAEALLGELKQRLRSLRPIDANVLPNDEQRRWCRLLGLINLEVGTRSEEDWYCFLHGAQGHLERTLEAGLYVPNHDFLNDSLYCEFAYIVNLDEQTFEFYEGLIPCSGQLHPGRYWAAVPPKELQPSLDLTHRYGPVALRMTMPLERMTVLDPEQVVTLMTNSRVDA